MAELTQKGEYKKFVDGTLWPLNEEAKESKLKELENGVVIEGVKYDSIKVEVETEKEEAKKAATGQKNIQPQKEVLVTRN